MLPALVIYSCANVQEMVSLAVGRRKSIQNSGESDLTEASQLQGWYNLTSARYDDIYKTANTHA